MIHLVRFLIGALLLVGVFANSVVFADGLRPVGISLMSDQVTPGFEMKFQIFETLNERQNVNHGEPEEWPADYLLELEYNLDYPAGVWGVHRVFMMNNLTSYADNTYGFVVPETVGYYKVTVKDSLGEKFISEIFQVAEEPFIVVDRVVAPGGDVVLKIYDEDGNPWNINVWGDEINAADEHSIDVYKIGNAGFVSHASIGMGGRGIQISDNQDGTYTYLAGDSEDDYYVRLYKGSGNSLIEFDSTSYDVYGEAVEEDEDEEEDDGDEDLPDVLEPETGDDDYEDVCDPGEYCPEDDEEEADDEDDDDDDDDRDFSLNTAAHANLPNFSFVNWSPKIILIEDFSYDEYDFESDGYDLMEDSYACDDLQGHWSMELVGNLLKGSKYPVEESEDKHLCRPDKEITREKLMAWLLFVFYPDLADEAQALDYLTVDNPYIDLDEDFGPYVLMATKVGIVHGQNACAKEKTANCKFGNRSTVNRAEILKMAIEAKGIEISIDELKAKYPDKDPVLLFEDLNDDEDWFYSYLYFATANNVIQGIQLGNDKFNAAMNQGLTFSQAAKIITLINGLK